MSSSVVPMTVVHNILTTSLMVSGLATMFAPILIFPTMLCRLLFLLVDWRISPPSAIISNVAEVFPWIFLS